MYSTTLILKSSISKLFQNDHFPYKLITDKQHPLIVSHYLQYFKDFNCCFKINPVEGPKRINERKNAYLLSTAPKTRFAV